MLTEAGAEVIDLDDPVDFEQILAWHRTVLAAEAAWTHDDDLKAVPDDYPDRIRDLVLEGRRANAVSYLKAHAEIGRILFPLEIALKSGDLDALVTPATVTTAPDPSTTGDPAFNSPWSFTGMPTVSFPSGLAADGLPVALQLIDRRGWEYHLLRTAEWCENAIRNARQ
jgi:Asp-tRNA(Asn)/Glu-tRNA(Gln) amidotransferase A subunit family amidase